MKNINQKTRMLCEGAVSIALAIALSFVEIELWFQGGSISPAMIPLVLFAFRWGCGWGVLAGLVFGTLKYFIGTGSWALDWVSIIFDYSAAYAAVGLAGLLKGKVTLLPLAATVGGAARFIIHFISGFTVYAKWMPDEFMGLPMTSPVLYSALYNGAYMLPSTIVTVLVCGLLIRPLRKWLGGETLK